MSYSIELPDESANLFLGQSLAREFEVTAQRHLVVYLSGTLGAGKTTLTRGIMRGFGYEGAVKSPTYTLVEPYRLSSVEVFHFDLYRLADPEELEFMGVRDYFESPLPDELPRMCIVEWPEQGGGLMPPADLHLDLLVQNQGRRANISLAGRGLAWQSWCERMTQSKASSA